MISPIKNIVIEQMQALGWVKATDDVSHAVLATFKVRTFRGDDFAEFLPIVVTENGVHMLKAKFISKGDNALALASANITESDDIQASVVKFHEEVQKHLADAFSVRMATMH